MVRSLAELNSDCLSVVFAHCSPLARLALAHTTRHFRALLLPPSSTASSTNSPNVSRIPAAITASILALFKKYNYAHECLQCNSMKYLRWGRSFLFLSLDEIFNS